jgi:hypothetical protein
MHVTMIDCSNRDGVDANVTGVSWVLGELAKRVNSPVGEAIEIALVVCPCSISTSKHKDRSLAIAAFLNTIHEGLLHKIAWALHRLTIVGGTPAAAIYRCAVISIVQRCGFIDIGYWTGENANARYLRVMCDANTTCVVLASSDLASTTSSVIVIRVNGGRKVGMVVEVIRPKSILKKGRKH